MKAKSILVENISTSAITLEATAIYTVPANTRSKLLYILLSNNTATTTSGIAVEVFNSTGAYLVESSKSLAANAKDDMNFGGHYIILEAGAQLRARADSTGVSCIATVEETTGLVSTN